MLTILVEPQVLGPNEMRGAVYQVPSVELERQDETGETYISWPKNDPDGNHEMRLVSGCNVYVMNEAGKTVTTWRPAPAETVLSRREFFERAENQIACGDSVEAA